MSFDGNLAHILILFFSIAKSFQKFRFDDIVIIFGLENIF